ncbi:hypothetical protein H0I76_13845 [Limibaculum sp. M0105]|uniref:Uncharacterized protein n=1 Tax=Thermohalobaculum xanthum TaxID=2753746 RepID=A0A8J7SDU0_9RHOB|nr:hypothetical protein [Thermohalobaculum xanthum]MBK0400277.1 hypothetical protein [Thermohalobaculum xanthum]
MALKALLRRLADGPKPAEEALVVVLPDADAARAASGLLARLADGSHRLDVVAAVSRRESAGALQPLSSLPRLQIRVPRLPTAVPVRAVLAGLRARAMVVVGAPEAFPRELARLVAGARRRGLPVYALPPDTLERLASGAEADGGFRPLSAVAAETMPAAGADFEAMVRHLARAVGIERGQGPLLDAASRRVQKTLATPPARRLLGRFVARIDTAEALSRRLGAPRTILCLGNGPTSAEPVLEQIAHDALFRVNHQWKSQGFLATPDMIFAGVKRSMRAAGRGPIGVATARKERALFAARLLEFWHGPFSYAVIEEIAAGVVPAIEGPLRPTTGAYMLAAAVALRPERIIVAGMDMFSHPAGAYPGGGPAENAYTPSHDLETDTAFIRGCLAAYEGEIATLSPAFAELALSVPAARFRLVEPEPHVSAS